MPEDNRPSNSAMVRQVSIWDPSLVTSAGGVVLVRSCGRLLILVVECWRDVEPRWAPVLRQLPKGARNAGESLEATARREVKEETGYDAVILGEAGVASWEYWRDGKAFRETVHYFLMTPAGSKPGAHDEEFDDVRWIHFQDAIDLLSYEPERAMLGSLPDRSSLPILLDEDLAASAAITLTPETSKAQGLVLLHGLLTGATIDKPYVLTVRKWREAPDDALARVGAAFPGVSRLAIRSSAEEETLGSSHYAGRFATRLGVPAHDMLDVRRSIDAVVQSYGRGKDCSQGGDEILIQPFVSDAALSGVVDLGGVDGRSAYMCVDYDDQPGCTDAVTKGLSGHTVYIPYWSAAGMLPHPWSALVATIREIEQRTSEPLQGIEFAVDSNGMMHVLQVRVRRTRPLDVAPVRETLAGLQAGLSAFLTRGSRLGTRTVLADMTDWNPAEMLGSFPHPLDRALYRYLVTESSWRESRRLLGYARPSRSDLMVVVGCKPYIDVLASIESLLPAGLQESTRERVAQSHIDRLTQEPMLQDRVEFDILMGDILSTADSRGPAPWDLDRDTRRKARLATVRHVNEILSRGDELLDWANAQTETIRSATSIPRAHYACPYALRAQVGGELQSARDNGVLPFAIAARIAFIGLALLRTLDAEVTRSADLVERVMHSTRSVTQDLVRDYSHLSPGEFTGKYGHLRPGSYNILARRYDQMELYLNPERSRARESATTRRQPRNLSSQELVLCSRALRDSGFAFDMGRLVTLTQRALAQREETKLLFTRPLSDAIEGLAAIGEGLGLTREELSFLEINDILQIGSGSDGGEARALAARNKQQYEIQRSIAYPSVIARSSDLEVVRSSAQQPTYVTRKRVEAPLHFLASGDSIASKGLDGVILVLDSADPGYDWVFTQEIRGLIAKTGGPGSHMALRCSQLGVPAAIGCGERSFRMLRGMQRVVLDCDCGTIEGVPLAGHGQI